MYNNVQRHILPILLFKILTVPKKSSQNFIYLIFKHKNDNINKKKIKYIKRIKKSILINNFLYVIQIFDHHILKMMINAQIQFIMQCL